MNRQEKEKKAQIQKLEAECFQVILFEMYRVMLHPNRYEELWEKTRNVREKYLKRLGNIQ